MLPYFCSAEELASLFKFLDRGSFLFVFLDTAMATPWTDFPILSASSELTALGDCEESLLSPVGAGTLLPVLRPLPLVETGNAARTLGGDGVAVDLAPAETRIAPRPDLTCGGE